MIHDLGPRWLENREIPENEEIFQVWLAGQNLWFIWTFLGEHIPVGIMVYDWKGRVYKTGELSKAVDSEGTEIDALHLASLRPPEPSRLVRIQHGFLCDYVVLGKNFVPALRAAGLEIPHRRPVRRTIFAGHCSFFTKVKCFFLGHKWQPGFNNSLLCERCKANWPPLEPREEPTITYHNY